MKKATVAEAKAHLSELIGEVAHAGGSVLIAKRGKPMAKLVPVDANERPHLAKVKGWLNADDPFFAAIDDIVAELRRGACLHPNRTPYGSAFAVTSCRECKYSPSTRTKQYRLETSAPH